MCAVAILARRIKLSILINILSQFYTVSMSMTDSDGITINSGFPQPLTLHWVVMPLPWSSVCNTDPLGGVDPPDFR